MKVPLLDLKAQYATIRAEVREAIDRVCDSQHFILGPEVDAFEKEIAAIIGIKHAIGVSSGTDALLVALMGIGIKPGDEVITSAYSFFATGGTIARLGARPVFADIEPATFNLDAEAAIRLISSKTKAIVPVHLFGRMANLEPLVAVSRERSIPLVEDAAQAIGATDGAGRQAGTVGIAGCFSFFPSKNLGAFGDGGLVATNDDALAEKIRVLRVHGSKPKYYHKYIGGNFRLDSLQAAILRVKLRHLAGWTAARRQRATKYRELFRALRTSPSVVLPSDTPGHIYNQFVIRCPGRNALRKYLEEAGIGTEVYYPVPLHQQECFIEVNGSISLPASESASADSLAIPVYPELSDAQQNYVSDLIKKGITTASSSSTW